MKIAIMDIDGVLADFEGWLVERVHEKFGAIAAYHNRHLYSWADRWDGKILEYASTLTRDKHSYHGLDPILDGVRFVKELANLETPILYVTSRPKECHHITSRWLQRNVWRFDDAIGLQVVENKAEYIANNIPVSGVSFIVDDNPDTCAYLKNHGFLCLCWRQLWNEDVFPAIIPTRDTFFLVENESDHGTDFLSEIKEVKYG